MTRRGSIAIGRQHKLEAALMGGGQKMAVGVEAEKKKSDKDASRQKVFFT